MQFCFTLHIIWKLFLSQRKGRGGYFRPFTLRIQMFEFFVIFLLLFNCILAQTPWKPDSTSTSPFKDYDKLQGNDFTRK